MALANTPNPAVLNARQADLALRDLTDPAAGPHAIQLMLDHVVRALRDAWDCSVRTHRTHPIVAVADNYDRLHYEPDAAARDARYARYVSSDTVLRSHTSAMVPDALRRLAGGPIVDELVVCPGMVYRRDAIDRLHTGTPHQVDLWRIASRRLAGRELERMVALVVEAILPGAAWRTEPRGHPYTLDGRQVDVLVDGQWIEIAECGLALPELLASSGIDPARHSGLALGMGLDRALMMRKGIEDIRLLRAQDPRIADQMLDLDPYRPVSSQPPITRDLSIAVDGAETIEDLGDRVRGALGPGAASVESVTVVDEASWDSLSDRARERLGMRRGQRNLLVRVVLRDVERTLTDAEANTLRDAIYAAVHRGRRHRWAGGDGDQAPSP